MPDRNRNRHGARPEFEVAYYTKELGKPLQRQLLQKQLAQLSESGNGRSSHGEDTTPEVSEDPPSQDRAG